MGTTSGKYHHNIQHVGLFHNVLLQQSKLSNRGVTMHQDKMLYSNRAVKNICEWCSTNTPVESNRSEQKPIISLTFSHWSAIKILLRD